MAKNDMSSFFYKLARGSRDIKAISSGNPRRIARRARNRVIGKKIFRKISKW